MDSAERRAHWDDVYATKAEDEVSWFQEDPAVSLRMIRAAGLPQDAPIIDVGGGASRLVDALIEDGHSALTVLDLSEQALAKTRARLGSPATEVNWIAADVVTWQPAGTYALWHDRATFHFLTEPEERSAYVDCVRQALRDGGHLIIATFAPDGPERCSGLPIVRHDSGSLGEILGPGFALVETVTQDHATPQGRIQRFQFSRFRRA